MRENAYTVARPHRATMGASLAFHTIQGTAAPDATLSLMLVPVAAGMALLLPALYLLFRVFKGRAPV